MKINPKKFEVKKNSKIIDVLNVFQKNKLNICCVIDENRNFIGTVTMSDIKKAYLKKATSNNKITNYFNKKPLIIKESVNENSISNILSSSKFFNIDPPLIPIIDKNKKLINLIEKNELFNYSKNFLSKDLSSSKISVIECLIE